MFELGKVYRRADVHAEFGGQQRQGIVTPARVAMIFLITGPGGRKFGYRDQPRADGSFLYFGEAAGKTGIPEDMAVKTIAGFCNSEHGGTLLIGVADEGSLHGLEDDYATFSKRGERGDRDLLGQHLQNVLIQRLGHAATSLVQWEFHRIDGNDVCRVHVEPSGSPVYEKKGDQSDFWWRFPTGTTAIKDETERALMIGRRWR